MSIYRATQLPMHELLSRASSQYFVVPNHVDNLQHRAYYGSTHISKRLRQRTLQHAATNSTKLRFHHVLGCPKVCSSLVVSRAERQHHHPRHHIEHSRHFIRHLGRRVEGSAKEEDLAYEEETSTIGRQSTEGC
jgi:hypothetical protein